MINVVIRDRRKVVGRIRFTPSFPSIDAPGLVGRPWTDWEAAALAGTLIACDGNKIKTAQILKISERTVYRKVAKYGLEHLCQSSDAKDPFGWKRKQRK